MKFIVMAWFALVVSACSQAETPVTKQESAGLTEEITVMETPTELLFEREYRKKISDNVEVRIQLKNSQIFGRPDRYQIGELRQADGNYVLFGIYHIADRIVQPELIAPIEQAVTEILAMDHAYIASNPSEFVDKQGVRWVKADQSREVAK